MDKTNKLAIIPVMLCFFAMGFVDLVGTASNFVKADLGLNDAQANIFPSLVFFWFLIFSVPTGMLMNKIGRKKTVLLSLIITFISLLLPLFGESFILMLIAFSLLGIGNALMQTSLNPLVSTVIKGGNLASTLTFGQFIKAIASFLAPYLATWGATAALPSFGLGWRILFPIYMVIGVIATLLLSGTPIEEETVIVENELPSRNIADEYIACFKLLGTPIVLLSFIGIMCHVGIDVGVNATAPKILQEKLGLTLSAAAPATSFYFLFRTLGCLTGSIILRFMKTRTFFIISVVMMALSMLGLYFDALHGYSPCRLRQFQCLLHGLCTGFGMRSHKEKRGKWTHDHGSFRWNCLPIIHGIGQRCRGASRRSGCNGSGSSVFVHVYKEPFINPPLPSSREGALL